MRVKQIVAILMTAAMVFSLAACGNNGGVSESGSGDSRVEGDSADEKLTVDVFDAYANYQGVQSGWFGKTLADKFNMELNIIAPNVAGGGETLYQTRSAAGNLGDLIILEKADMKECIEAGLAMDITDYLKDCKYLNKLNLATDAFADYAGTGDAVFAIPTQASLDSPMDPALRDGKLPTASYIVWDYYKEIGAPEITDMDSLLDILGQMVEAHPVNENGDKTYAFSLFKDWDSNHLFLAERLCSIFGYGQKTETYLSNGDANDNQLLLADDGIYKKALKLYYEANQRGLLDPDSASQNFDTMTSKISNKQVMYVWWSWMTDYYNTTEKGNRGDGYTFVPITNSKIITDGKNPYGSDGLCIAIGANASEPGRLIELLDWLASPEGMDYTIRAVEGLSYEVKDGRREMTEFGQNAYVENRSVPEEWGGGGFMDGECKLNTNFYPHGDTNPETGEPYAMNEWESSRELQRTTMDEEWSEKYGEKDMVEYVKKNDMLSVMPGNTWVMPIEDSELQIKRTQCNKLVVETSWKMVYAADEAEFEQLWSDMKASLTGLGYDDVVAADTEYLSELQAAIEDSVRNFGK